MPSATVNQVEVVSTASVITAGRRRNVAGVLALPWAQAMAALSPSAWWRFDSASLLTDSSGNTHTLSGGTTGMSTVAGLVNGDSNGALSFTTGGNYFFQDISGTAASWPNSGTISVACVVQIASAPATTECIIDRAYQQNLGTYGHFSLRVEATTGKAQWVYYNTSGTPYTATSTASICDGQPHLLIATMNPTTKAAKLYVDSATVNASTTLVGTARSSVTTMMVSVGASTYSPVAGSYFHGVLDEATVWAGTELSSTQVASLVNAYAGTICEVDSAQRIAYTRFFPLGQVTDATPTVQTIRPVHSVSFDTMYELDAAQAITPTKPVNATFTDREDLSEDFVSGIADHNLLLANTQAGEYTNGLTATVWWEWTTPYRVPYSVTWSFTWSGQSASGGAALRLYSDTGEVLPVLADLLDEDVGTGASGTVSLTLTPAADTTYYLQQGIEEKAGTVGRLDQDIAWEAPPAPFTPVVPWP